MGSSHSRRLVRERGALRETRLEVVLPVYDNLLDDEGLEGETIRMLDELRTSSRRDVLAALEGSVSVLSLQTEVYAVAGDTFPPLSELPHPLFHELYAQDRGFRDAYVVRVIAQVKPDKTMPLYGENQRGETEFTRHASPSLLIDFASEEFLKAQLDWVVMANLASPGSIEVGTGYLFVNDLLRERSKARISSLHATVARCARTGWPRLRTLSTEEILDWVNEHGYQRLMGETPVARAYAAFTYSFEEPGASEPLRLFWLLMGVEALFVSEPSTVQQQVKQKSELLLGEQEAFKKEFRKMYRFRSAFVHGGIPFPARDFPYEAMPAFEKFEDELDRATTFAESLLIGSLQELVVRGWHYLDFDVIMRGQ